MHFPLTDKVDIVATWLHGVIFFLSKERTTSEAGVAPLVLVHIEGVHQHRDAGFGANDNCGRGAPIDRKFASDWALGWLRAML